MSAILKFDFKKREQLSFSEANFLNYTKKDPILHFPTTFSLKQGETRTSLGPIPHPLSTLFICSVITQLISFSNFGTEILGIAHPLNNSYIHKLLVHYLKWSSFVFCMQIYSGMHAYLSLS